VGEVGKGEVCHTNTASFCLNKCLLCKSLSVGCMNKDQMVEVILKAINGISLLVKVFWFMAIEDKSSTFELGRESVNSLQTGETDSVVG
jgi:hypothetical protein